MDCLQHTLATVKTVPIPLLLLFTFTTVFGVAVLIFCFIFLVAPEPRPPTPSEKTYIHVQEDGNTSSAKQLPCWLDTYNARRDAARKLGKRSSDDTEVGPAEVFLSLVVPAYNEEARLSSMLNEAMAYLEQHYGPSMAEKSAPRVQANGSAARPPPSSVSPTGYEILLISDGSTDATISTALSLARALPPVSRPLVRIVSLEKNRGKGGAVVHGLRHVRGRYALFADADGATRFSDLGTLLEACKSAEDSRRRAVAVGSRAHLVGSDAVVKRSFLRNFLMHSFHLFLRLLTPPATGRIKDTQCGFKLFSRAALADVIPFMHCEGWIFDVEMLMLAEAAGIAVVECPVGWLEIGGSKLNVLWDSLGMAWGLSVLRCAWGMGIYKRS